MRDYAKIEPKAWHGHTFKNLRKKGPEALIVGLYLMTSPSSNMLGLYAQPILYMAHETGLGEEGALKGLEACMEAGFCNYDHQSEVIWVHEMAKYQIAPELKATDLRCKGIQKDYDALPNNPFLGPFFDYYTEVFHMTSRREFEEQQEGAIQAPLLAPSKPRTRAGTGTRAGTRKGAKAPLSAESLPTWMQSLIDAYHQVLPELPGVAVMNTERQQAARDFREWVMTTKRKDGTARATNDDEMVAWASDYFGRARHNDFIMGRGTRSPGHENWRCSFEYLLSAKGMQKVIEQTTESAS